VGASLLNLYLQSNYTGPAPSEAELAEYRALLGPLGMPAERASLEADGEGPYSRSVLPEALAAARGILHALSLPAVAAWNVPMGLAADGKPCLVKRAPAEKAPPCMHGLDTANLWALRALVTHRRILPGRNPTPGLWLEAQTLAKPLLRVRGCLLPYVCVPVRGALSLSGDAVEATRIARSVCYASPVAWL
jgi:hypothetical protein